MKKWGFSWELNQNALSTIKLQRDYAHRGYRLKVMRSMTMARKRRYAEGIAWAK